MRAIRSGWVVSLMLLTGVAGAAEPSKPSGGQAAVDDGGQAPPAESRVTTAHTATIGSRVFRYQATAGTLVIRSDDGKPAASMFYIAYVVAPSKGEKRPITFLFNGGPGSASHWLNIGGFGPVHVVTASPSATGPAPYRIDPGTWSLLDKSDLVFVDAVGTGYSRVVGAAKDDAFWGVDSDVDAFAKALTRYMTVNQRWGSPKFLLGESYGTTRAAALVYKLQNQGMQFNGVILMSSILNFNAAQPGLDQGFIGLLPSFSAAAWFHGKVNPKPADLREFLREARTFAQGSYAQALAKGDTLGDAEEDSIAAQLSHFTGLSPEYLKRCKLRIDMEAFRHELLRDRALVIGRFDSRFTAPDSYLASSGSFDPATDDPATAGVSSAYLSSYRDYLAGDLGYTSELSYRSLYNSIIEPAWDWHHKAPGLDERLKNPNTALDLAAAMRGNPELKVFSMNGLYDMATPFFATEFDLSHMLLTSNLRGNVKIAYYDSGHMTYGDQEALKQMKGDLARFYDETLAIRTN